MKGRTKKFVKRDYSLMSPMEVYNLVRSGELGKFPNNYLDKDTIKEIVRHVFLKELRYTREDILCVDHKYFMRIYMGGFRKFFELTDYKILQYCFPEYDLKPWEFRRVEQHFWVDEENQKEFLLWVMKKENLDPRKREDLRKLNARMIITHGGSRLLRTNDDIFDIISVVNEGRYKEWEIMKVGGWTEAKVIEAVKWLVEEKLNYSLEQACSLRVRDFKRHNLDGMLQKGCNHSILYALNLAYDNRFARDGIRGIYLKSNG